jgi:hypothetical protein
MNKSVKLKKVNDFKGFVIRVYHIPNKCDTLSTKKSLTKRESMPLNGVLTTSKNRKISRIRFTFTAPGIFSPYRRCP